MLTSVVNYAPTAEVADLFVRYSDSGRANDVLLLQLYMSVHLPDAEVENLLAAFDWDAGCWRDIDYADTNRGRWPSTLHVTRMYSIAKLYKAGNNLMKGLLIDDEAIVVKSRDIIAEEMCVTDAEGVQKDWSFHQHGPQIQFGNYGLTYVEGLSFWMRVLKDTAYDFTEEQKQIVCNLMKEGICWSVYRGVMDPSYCGRQNFIDAGPGKAFALAVAAQNMAVAMDSEKDFFNNVANECLLPSVYDSLLTGARYFWRSDCGIYRSPHWYASVRMHSDRTIGFEFTNRENTLANFSADGAVILMQDAQEFSNIFAIWDWRKVPGVTAYDDRKPIKCDTSIEGRRNDSGHVGGLACGNVLAATMELDRDGLHALKSSFFFEDCVVCLGADIKVREDAFVSVTVLRNDADCQAVLHGDVLCAVFHKGGEYVLNGERMSAVSPSVVVRSAGIADSIILPDL